MSDEEKEAKYEKLLNGYNKLVQEHLELEKENEELKEEKERAVGLYAQAGLNVKSLNGMVNELDNKVKLKDKAIEKLQKENQELKEKIKEYEIGIVKE